MIHPLISYDLDSIDTVDDALLLIERNLNDLIEMSPPIISAGEDRKIMISNVRFVKRYYERVELLLLKDSV